MHRTIISSNIQATKQLGARLGQRLKGGEVIELVGDLGSGKTTLVQGLAKGIGSSDHVASPTFTISRLYRSDKLELHHFDFYRLQDAGLMEHELHDVAGDPAVIVIVEWGDVVTHVLPEDRLTIRLVRTGDESRRFELHYPKKLSYLVEDIS